MELRVAQARLGDAIERRRGNDAAEGARRAEAHVVGHDEQYVGRPFGRHDRGAHQAFDCKALSLMTPPNFGSGGGSCLPLIVVVAPGDPNSPVTCGAEASDGGAALPVGGARRGRRNTWAELAGRTLTSVINARTAMSGLRQNRLEQT